MDKLITISAAQAIELIQALAAANGTYLERAERDPDRSLAYMWMGRAKWCALMSQHLADQLEEG